MAEEEVGKSSLLSETPKTATPPPFLEVTCKSSGDVRRFAAGTEAEFAVSLINRKLDFRVPRVSYIEAIKEGEEPVSFGPHSVLVDYGDGWKLQTVTESEGIEKWQGLSFTSSPVMSSAQIYPVQRSSGLSEDPKGKFLLLYIGKIVLAFLFIFMLGAMFTFVLENLPSLFPFITSSV